ncbi:MAG: hypothetical protein BGO78_13165 [Chloroflexi bacterium 44-23]|nr:MAG: hypothetical protein BGO78_13165 [Chloroflexi bacterium 44-23]
MHQPLLPLTNLTFYQGANPRNLSLKNNSAGGHFRLEQGKKDIEKRRASILRYLQLYREKSTFKGSLAIANYIAFAISDYNSFIRNIFSPYKTPAEYLFEWERIQLHIHQIANNIESQPPNLPDSPTDMQLIRYFQRN